MKIVKDSTTPKPVSLPRLYKTCLKIVKDSTTPKHRVIKGEKIICLKIVKDSTTPKPQKKLSSVSNNIIIKYYPIGNYQYLKSFFY